MRLRTPVRAIVCALTIVAGLPVASAYADPPPAPSLDAPLDGSQLLRTHAQISCSGAQPNAQIRLYVDGAFNAVFTAANDGSCSFTTNGLLADDATHTFAITQTVGGEESAPTPTHTVTVQTLPSPLIYSPAGIVATTTPSIYLSDALPGGKVEFQFDGAGTLFTTHADGSGNVAFALPTPLAQGDHSVVGYVLDDEGNINTSNTKSFTVLPAPVITPPASELVNSGGGPLALAFTGAEPGATVTLLVDGSAAGATVVADSAGAGTMHTPDTPADGVAHQYSLSQDDNNGHVSAQSDVVRITVDNTAPSAPTVVSPADGATTDDGANIEYSVEPGAMVQWQLDGVDQTALTAFGDGTVALYASPAPAEGLHTIRARAVDATGNIGPWSETTTYTVDRTPPSGLTLDSPDGFGLPTNDNSGRLSFTTDPGSTVEITLNGGAPLSHVADGQGHATFDVGRLADGAYTIHAITSDPAGNGLVFDFHVTVDTTPPAAATVTSPTAGATLTQRRFPIAFTTPGPDQVVSILIDGHLLGAAESDGAGHGVYAMPGDDGLADGPHAIVARTTDLAGNHGDSAPIAFTVDVASLTRIPPAAATTPASTPAPPAPAAPKFGLSDVVLHGRTVSTCPAHRRHCHERTARLTFAVNGPATVRLTFVHRVHGRDVTVARVTIAVRRAGSSTYVVHRRISGRTLRAGAYRVLVHATSASGAASSSNPAGALTVR